SLRHAQERAARAWIGRRLFLAWRKRQPALKLGDIRFLDAPETVLAFERTCAEQRLLLAFNFGLTPATVPLPVPGSLRVLPAPGMNGTRNGTAAEIPALNGLIAVVD
ncbi:MAG TPA: DUF3459 domain-containing protein, partial [Defluviicoccus sp.]|nr:DUF3459 domain-containing protein [Defluviicoccus sp.]